MTTITSPTIKTFITETGSRISRNEVSHIDAIVVDVLSRHHHEHIQRSPMATKLMLVLRDGSSVLWRTMWNTI
jgi:hypothetical protein